MGIKTDVKLCPNDNSILTLVKGVVNRTTIAMQDDQWGYWWECLECNFTEDLTEEEMSQIHDDN